MTVLMEFCPAARSVVDVVGESASALEQEMAQQGKHLSSFLKQHLSGQWQSSSNGNSTVPAPSAGAGERDCFPMSLLVFAGPSTSHESVASPSDTQQGVSIPAHSSHDTETVQQEMAGLLAFSGSTLRQFMTAPVATQRHSTEQKVSSVNPKIWIHC